MYKKKKIIVGISFNTKKLDNNKQSLTPQWIRNRIRIFQNYTRKSLQKQSNQNYLALIEYEDSTKKVIQKALRCYGKLPHNIRFIPRSRYERTMKKAIKGYRNLYLVRLDSDDLYRRNYIQQLHHHRASKRIKAIINQKGYMYGAVQHQIAPMKAKSPPFYTLVYKVKDYLRGKRYRLKGGHPAVIRLPHDKLHVRNFVHIIHSGNTTSTFRSKRNKQINLRKLTRNSQRVRRILRKFM